MLISFVVFRRKILNKKISLKRLGMHFLLTHINSDMLCVVSDPSTMLSVFITVPIWWHRDYICRIYSDSSFAEGECQMYYLTICYSYSPRLFIYSFISLCVVILGIFLLDVILFDNVVNRWFYEYFMLSKFFIWMLWKCWFC